MRKFVIAAAACFLLTPVAGGAGELAGVTMPATAAVNDRVLKLNGMGIRTKFFVKVYVGGLYLENTTKNPAEIVSIDVTRHIELSFLRDVDGPAVLKAIYDGFEKNSKPQMESLKGRLEKMKTMLPDVKKGGSVSMTYVPGRGIVVNAMGMEKGVLEGKDFADAMFLVWLGPNPVDEKLKKGLLGL